MKSPREVPNDAAALDCRTCGACCVAEGASPIYVGLRPPDLVRLTARFRATHVARDAILTQLDPVGRCVCVALRGTVGKRTSCGIHARRPEECRLLEPGSPDCLRARRQNDL